MQAGGDPKRDDEVDVDFEVATPTRFGAWTETGEAQFEIDRDVTARLYASHPGGIDAFRTVGTAAQAFVERAVRYVIDEAGVRQFLVIGSSVSGRANVHEVAQAIAPDARVVYVLFDPLMLVYAHRLLNGANEGTTAYVQARLRDVDEILNRSAATLDFAQLRIGQPLPAVTLRQTKQPPLAERIEKPHIVVGAACYAGQRQQESGQRKQLALSKFIHARHRCVTVTSPSGRGRPAGPGEGLRGGIKHLAPPSALPPGLASAARLKKFPRSGDFD